MIYAELNHNPYLLQTEVKFNGNEPRINSQIEKYENWPLKDWVQKVPEVFYNEMNGYDFDLLVKGTASDFQEIVDAFGRAGVSNEQVRVILKNELENPETKSREIDSLLEWFRHNPNRKFDFTSFWEEYHELFDGTYPLIILHGSIPESLGGDISPETIGSVEELKSTVLKSTPIIINIDQESESVYRHDLTYLLNREDVRQEQVFFVIHSSLDLAQICRVISDLGVENPQIVETYNSPSVMSYMQNYPVTEYIRSAVRILQLTAEKIEEILRKENEQNIIQNQDLHGKIEQKGEKIELLKNAIDFFRDRSALSIPEPFSINCINLTNKIAAWQNRKVKVSGEEEISAAAVQYEEYLNLNLTRFRNIVWQEYQEAGAEILDEYTAIYEAAEPEHMLVLNNIDQPEVEEPVLPKVKEEFRHLRRVSFKEGKNDFIGKFLKQQDTGGEVIKVVTGYYDEWRAKAEQLVMPIAERYIDGCFAALQKYADILADAFQKQLEEELETKNQEKIQLASQLSDEERFLQEDNDWFMKFKDQLNWIERG